MRERMYAAQQTTPTACNQVIGLLAVTNYDRVIIYIDVYSPRR